jgi:ribosomal protein L12E/L44/L45/RPP1/RPP2
MKSLLMAIMTVAVAVTFSAPSFAGKDMKSGHADTSADKKDDKKKKEEKKEERPK